MRSLTICSALFWMTILAASSSTAATLNVVGGQLLGASNVDVDGSLYNVEFLDGTCIALFRGCDSAADFAFNSETDALGAAQALLDQVFLDVAAGDFDTFPNLTNGCIVSLFCAALLPYDVTPGLLVNAAFSINHALPVTEPPTGPISFDSSFDTTPAGANVFAVFTLVPEPGTGVLVALGLLAMGVRARRAA